MVERKRINSDDLTGDELIVGYIEVESVVSTGTLVALDRTQQERRLLGEVAVPTERFTKKSDSGEYRFLTGRALSRDSLDDLTSHLISSLLLNSNLSSSGIDFLTAYSDAFVGLDEPEESTFLIRDILDSCTKKLDIDSSELKFDTPKFAANELKSRKGATGAERIIKLERGFDVSTLIFIDLSTIASGLVKSEEKSINFNGLIVGLGSAILDSLAKGYGGVNHEHGNTFKIPKKGGKIYRDEVDEFASQATELIDVRRVSSGTKQIGKVPVDVEETYDKHVRLVGCDVGRNGSDLSKITGIGRKAASYGSATLQKLIDKIFARLVGKIVSSVYEEELIDNVSSLCVSGRRDVTKNKIAETLNLLNELGFKEVAKNTFFVENPATFGWDTNF